MTEALQWRKTNAPVATSRTDDIWFVSPDVGWAVNSNGQILNTTDGGRTWAMQHQDGTAYLRCVGFANKTTGWVGAISSTPRMFRTVNGTSWSVVDNLPPKPVKICGISVVDEQVIYASGTNDPRDDPAVIKTTDGGATWTSIDMRAQAAMLIDIHFQTRDRGWVVGGRDVVACPGRRATREVVRPVVLFTENGGATWTDLIPRSAARTFPLGEWGWKLFFLDDRTAFVSLENFLDGAFLKSTDGGRTWERLRINDQQRNSNLEGIGFISENVGWVGGWGDLLKQGGFTSATQDGKNWQNANEVGFRLNRFRFFGNPVSVGYASGDTVYKYSTEPVGPVPLAAAPAPTLMKTAQAQAVLAAPADVTIDVPPGARALAVTVWDRFGNTLQLAAEQSPRPGPRIIAWNPADPAAAHLLGNAAVLRVVIDDQIESTLVALT
jgi:photosystem II stability/assembly factor-like uncharacterized protein